MKRATMNNCASPRRSNTTSPQGSQRLHRPTIVVPGASYEVELPAIRVEFSSVPDSRRGARRHPHPNIDVFRIGRQAPAKLSTTVKKTESTHINRSPINPVHFIHSVPSTFP